MPPPYANTIRVSNEAQISNEIQVNVFHVLVDAGFDVITNGAALSVPFRNFYMGLSTDAVGVRGIKNYRANDHVMTRTVIKDLRVADGDSLEVPFVTGAGTATGDMLPFQTAYLVSLRTAVNSRRGRGRSYLGGMVETSLEENNGRPQWIAAVTTDVLDAFEDLEDSLAVLVDVTGLAVLSESAGVARHVTSFRADAIPRQQRRRAGAVLPAYVTRVP